MNILFSPIGTTDPITNLRDGAMLHICRYYPIDKVYLYMSEEINGYHKGDNRYLYCLEKLSEKLGRKIEHELIVKEELRDVHLFDPFIGEFEKIICDIRAEYPNAKLYLNISSGTPGMKSALQIMAAKYQDTIPIQVATPEKKSNPKVEELEKYEVEAKWNCNEDNADPIDRTSVSENSKFIVLIKKQILSQLIENYDYHGAKLLADDIKNSLNPETVELICGAAKRYNLDYEQANNIFRKYEIKLLEHKQSDLAPLSEYLLRLDLKAKKGEYGDFLVSVTPLIADLFEMILKKSLKFDVNNYVADKSQKNRKWDYAKIQSDVRLKEVFKRLKPDDNRSIFSSDMNEIIQTLSKDSKLSEVCDELRKIDSKRNIPAHEITSVTSETIKNATGLTPEQIIKKFKTAFSYAGITLENDFFKSYDRMNERIKEAF